MNKLRRRVWPALCFILCAASLPLSARAAEALDAEEAAERAAVVADAAELYDGDSPEITIVYTVTFDAQGGSVSPDSISVNNGETYGRLPAPTREGYRFAGWFTEPDGGAHVYNQTNADEYGDTTLYAHWTGNAYTVKFDAQGGSVSPDSVTVAKGETYGRLPAPTREGYRFAGWFTEPDGGAHVYNQTNADEYGDTTLYARWTGNGYAVTFDAQGGSVSPDSMTVSNGGTYGALPMPTRSGYRFSGWFTAPDGGDEITAASPVSLSANQTLYARWARDDAAYIVIFDGNGGAVSPASKTVTNGEPYGDLPTPTRNNYRFDGWFTEPDAASDISSDTASYGGDKIESASIVNLSANQTLYARWTPDNATHTVIFDGNGGAVSPASKTVTNGEPYGDLPTPTRNNYRFAGWFTAPDDGDKIESASTVNLSANATLYAHWKEIPQNPALENLSYSFVNSHDGMGYREKPYYIPYERYVMIFGDTMFAQMCFLTAGAWAGNCFGFSATSAMFSQSDSGAAVGDFNADASIPAELRLSDENPDWNINLQQFLETMQVSQNDPAIQADINANKDKLDELCQAVSTFEKTGKEPVLVAVFGRQGGHALLGYKLEKVDDDESRLYVYDCNYPAKECYITLTTNASGQYQSWSYRISERIEWGSAFKGSWISYVPYASFHKVWNDREQKSAAPMEALTVNADVVIRDFKGNSLASLENGELFTMRKDIYPVVRFGITADGESMPDDASVWIPVDIYSLERLNDHVRVNGEAALLSEDAPFEASVTHRNQSSEVSTTAKGFSFLVDDKSGLNRVMFGESVESGTYNITFHSTLNGQEEEAQVQGDVMSHLMMFCMANGVAEADELSMKSIRSYKLNGLSMENDDMTAASVASIVNFVANGGGGVMSPLPADDDGTFTFPACDFAPPRPGQAFVGWAVNGTLYLPGETVTLKDSATATAQWMNAVADVVVSGGGVTVKLSEPAGSGLSVAVCAYSAGNQMLRCAVGDAKDAPGASGALSLTLDASGAAYLKAFLLDARTQRPVAEPFRKNL